MKKALKMVSVFISIIMCLSLSVPVFAATEDAVYNQLDARLYRKPSKLLRICDI